MAPLYFKMVALLIGITSLADGESLDRKRSFAGIQARIKGGHDAPRGDYPWQAIVFRKLEGELVELHCGASVIRATWILTAAHCFSDPNITLEDYDVIAGEHDLTVEEGSEQRFHITMVLCHGDYNMSKGNNDIALLKLHTKMNFDEFVKPIKLATAEEDIIIEENTEIHCVTTGWGNKDYDKPDTNILQALDMPVLSLQTCKEAYKDSNVSFYEITEDMLCTGYATGNMSACYGDAGGPLACQFAGEWTLLGLSSWGKECGLKGFPELYVRVAYFRDWILDVMNTYS